MITSSRARTSEYWKDEVDTKKVMIHILEKWWIILAGIVVGVILGAVAYFGYHFVADGEVYEAYSQFYLDFAQDDRGEAYQYYNGYTWNELMTTNLIADNTLAELGDTGVTLETLEQTTLAEIKSDIRVLRVTFTDTDVDRCSKIQSATEKALIALGDSAKEFNSISVIKSVSPSRVYADDRLLQAMLLGAIIAVIIAVIGIWALIILDDRVCVPADVYSLGIPVLGVELSSSDDKLAKRLHSLTEISENNMVSGLGITDPNQIYRLDALAILEDGELNQMFEEARGAKAVVIEVPYRKVTKRLLEKTTHELENQGCQIVGITIVGAGKSFYRLYL